VINVTCVAATSMGTHALYGMTRGALRDVRSCRAPWQQLSPPTTAGPAVAAVVSAPASPTVGKACDVLKPVPTPAAENESSPRLLCAASSVMAGRLKDDDQTPSLPSVAVEGLMLTSTPLPLRWPAQMRVEHGGTRRVHKHRGLPASTMCATAANPGLASHECRTSLRSREICHSEQAAHLKGCCSVAAALFRVELEAEHALHCKQAQSLHGDAVCVCRDKA